MSLASIPSELVNAFREGRAIVFIGAGASMTAGLPSWNDLVADLAQELNILPDAGTDFSPSMLSKVPQYYENQFGRPNLFHKLERLIQPHTKRKSPVHNFIAQLPCELFYTTNFDELLEEALRDQEVEFDIVASEETARAFAERRRCQIRKTHGTITQPQTLVITRRDYACFMNKRPLIVEALRNDLYTNVFLFVGYSLRDPDFNSIYDHVFNTMQDMAQRHFICMPSISDYEEEDLKARSLATINLSLWDGGDQSEKLINFLKALAESTSETIHIKRFFQGIKRGDNLPIVVNSKLHDVFGYSFYPACDIHVIQQIQKALHTLGCTFQIIPDMVAISDTDPYLHSNIILVCSPFGNIFAKHLFELADKINYPFNHRFTSKGSQRSFKNINSRKEFKADDPTKKVSNKVRKEYALIARYNNPWSPGKYIYLFAGLHALGTHAVGDFLSNLKNYRNIPYQGKDSAVVLELEYKEHDPNKYKYDLKSITPL